MPAKIRDLNVSDLRGKNLLAFSGGIDSSALFAWLMAQGVDFDIAIMHFGLREGADFELAHAHHLAKIHGKKIYEKRVKSLDPKNFENFARQKRYEFFDEIMDREDYENLLTAHQLNDRFEWFLMQLFRGAGVANLLGFPRVSKRKNYKIIRPFFEISRREILNFLRQNSVKFFIDESNENQKFLRNKIRHSIANDMVLTHENGILRTLQILENEKNFLHENFEITNFINNVAHENLEKMLRDFVSHAKNSKNISKFNFFRIYAFQRRQNLQNIFFIEQLCKQANYVISAAQRKEIIKTDFCCEIAGKFLIDSSENLIFWTKKPLKMPVTMEKNFKNICARQKIPPKMRQKIAQILKNHSQKVGKMIKF